MSTIGWIVGTLKERDAALELLRDDGDAEPQDELGIASLRDALSNAFFPGVTTLQTRAKYFLLVPRMYQEVEGARGSRVPAPQRIRQLEAELLERLRDSGEHGIIGSRSWRVPQTPASGIYWTGLHTWRIRIFSDSRPYYHRWLDSGRHLPLAGLSDDDPAAERALWHQLPVADELLSERTLNLNLAQAEFLRDRILAIQDRPERSLLKDLAAAGSPPEGAPFWALPIIQQAALGELAADAALLSVALLGAMLVYNHECARLREVPVTDWAARLDQWSQLYQPETWRDWDLAAFWNRVKRLDDGRAEDATRSFVDRWVGELRRRPPGSAALRLIVDRESATKPGRARLSGAETLAGWDPTGGVGAGPLQFRWPQARSILTDILVPIQNS